MSVGITLLGATGSIGRSTLDVIARHPTRYHVVALTAQRDVAGMTALCAQHQPAYAVMADPDAAERLRRALNDAAPEVNVLAGTNALEYVVTLPTTHTVMAAIVGAAGLLPTLAAARAGKRILLANKEALVMSGALFMEAVRTGGAELLPVDSEHNAIFQCLPHSTPRAAVRRILLTASGGPFRCTPLAELASVTPQQAVAHPNWSMGRKISVDSATMMNKGLEVIEAHWLFALPAERIEVVIHSQSVVHSLVEYVDGSILAQLGSPDMRTPIASALAWPERISSGVTSPDLCALGRLDFEAPDLQRFPCLGLAYAALRAGGTAPTLLNAANEVAVAAFLAGHISFTEIAVLIERTLEHISPQPQADLDTVLAQDAQARHYAQTLLEGTLARQ